MQDQHIYAKIREKIGQDKLDQVLAEMKRLLEENPRLDEVIQLSGRFKDIQKQQTLSFSWQF